MTSILYDLRFALRVLARSPSFAAVAVLCLALGIGANTGVFSLANALLLRSLPLPQPEQVVRAYFSYEDGLRWGTFSYLDYRDLQAQAEAQVQLEAEMVQALSLAADERNERLFGSLVSAGYFRTLGVKAAAGRVLLPEDGKAVGSSPVAVLSHRLWQRRFHSDPAVVGKALQLNGRAFTVVGVAEPAFRGTMVGFVPELWLPLTMEPAINPGSQALEKRDARSLLVLGRLQQGSSVASAGSVLERGARQLAQTYPETNRKTYASLIPEREGGVHPMYRGVLQGALGVLQAVVGLVLILACANVAVLLVSRAAERQQEVAVRLAVGAGRWQLVRQLLTESLLLTGAAGLLGLLLALGLQRLVQGVAPMLQLPITIDLGLDGRVLVFTVLVSILTALAFSLVPARQALRTDLVTSLKDRASARVGGRSRLQGALVVGQVTVSSLLVIAAGLLVRGLMSAQRVDLGFEPDGVLTAAVDLSSQGYGRSRGQTFYRRALDELSALPSVRAVSLAQHLPLSAVGNQRQVLPEGPQPAADSRGVLVDYNVVSEGYFSALSIRLLAGRTFDQRDRAGSVPMAVVNQSFVRRFWPEGRAVGRRFRSEGQTFEVAGVVEDGKYSSLGEAPKPYFYLSLSQAYRGVMRFVLDSQSEAGSLQLSMQETLRQLDGTLALHEVRTLDRHLEASLLPVRASVWAVGSFGLLAVLLSAVGLYGTLAYAVAGRRREIGMRMALGAQRQQVLLSALGPGLSRAMVGALIGMVAALAATRVLSSLLYGVSPLDPLTFAVGFLLIVGISALAGYVPARRALATDPASTLREG